MLDYEKSFMMDTDASGKGIGAMLIQQGHQIAYITKPLTPKHQAMYMIENSLPFVVLK